MSDFSYRIYPSLLDKFQSFVDMSAEDFFYQDENGGWHKNYNESTGEYHYTDEEVYDLAKQDLINAINRVRSVSEAASKGTAFNELVDALINNKKSETLQTKKVYYDVNGNFLGEDERYLFTYDDGYYATFYIDGEVDSYEILEFNIEYHSNEYIFYVLAFIAFVFLIYFLLFSCKEYRYNDNHIVVYAGFSNHYIKVNGEKMDEYIASISFGPVELSCTLKDDTTIKATISTSNRIALKINNVLYSPK